MSENEPGQEWTTETILLDVVRAWGRGMGFVWKDRGYSKDGAVTEMRRTKRFAMYGNTGPDLEDTFIRGAESAWSVPPKGRWMQVR